jgi:hypothetical protein
MLNETHVPRDITFKSIKHLESKIETTNYLNFKEDELGPKGTGHNKALYITIKCKNYMIAKVFIDNDSFLNLL